MKETLAQRRKKVLRDGFLILVSIVVAILIHQSQILENLLKSFHGVSFVLGAFVVGIFFASTFTVSIATSVFLTFAQSNSAVLIALFGGLGALLGDSLIFKFLRDDLIADFEYLSDFFPKKTARTIIHSKLLFWFVPIVAAIMIASPIPDEVGLFMLAGIKLKYRHFLFLSFILNTAGILAIAMVGNKLF